MIANLSKSLLEAISDNYKKGGAPGIFSVRELRGIDRFLEVLKTAINKKVDNLISKIELLNEKQDLSILDSYDRSLYLHLRVFQENLMMIFPPELVIELTSCIVNQKEYPILADISLKEITALSYLVVYLLVREQIFLSQRIYLVGANYVSREFSKEELKDKVNIEDARFIKITFKLSSVEYGVVLVLSEKVFSRIKSHLRLMINKEELNQKLELYFNLELNFTSLPVSSLFELKKGQILEFNRSDSNWFLRLLKTNKDLPSTKIPLNWISTGGSRGLQFKFN